MKNMELRIIFLGEIFIFQSGSSVARQWNTFWSPIGVSQPHQNQKFVTRNGLCREISRNVQPFRKRVETGARLNRAVLANWSYGNLLCPKISKSLYCTYKQSKKQCISTQILLLYGTLLSLSYGINVYGCATIASLDELKKMPKKAIRSISNANYMYSVVYCTPV